MQRGAPFGDDFTHPIEDLEGRRSQNRLAGRTEDEMVRGGYINRADSERTTLQQALKRYLREVSSTKKPSTEAKEHCKSKHLIDKLGDFSLAAITPDVVANYRDEWLADSKSANTVRLELALLSHVFTIAIREWRMGITYNSVNNASLFDVNGPAAELDRETAARPLSVYGPAGTNSCINTASICTSSSDTSIRNVSFLSQGSSRLT